MAQKQMKQNFVRTKKSKHDSSMKIRSNLAHMKKQRGKYPVLAADIVQRSDIVLEILDLRYLKETRNPEIEELIRKAKRKIIYVFNKSDLIDKDKIDKEYMAELRPGVFVSCVNRKGISNLRDKIKAVAGQIDKPVDKLLGKVTVGVVGYPNTGKSSVINVLRGKSVAPVSGDAGFTKGIQKVNLTEKIVLLDSPGIIPNKEYSGSNIQAISRHTKVGARSFTQVKYPDVAASDLIQAYPESFESFFGISFKGDPEDFIEELGRKKGFLIKGNEVNVDQTARLILKEWQEGRIRA